MQEAREATALGALYMNESQIPDSPAEPSQVMPEEEVDKNAVIMTLGPDNEDLTWNAEMMAGGDAASGPGPMAVDPLAAAAALQAQPAVAQLLQQLGAIDPSVLQALPQPAATAGGAEAFGANAGSTLQHLIQQLQTGPGTFGGAPGYEQGQQQQQQGASGGWGGEYDQADYPGSAGGPGGGWGENSSGGRRGRGRGGRGPGGRGGGGGGPRSASDGFKSNRRIPCTFFAEGRRASERICFSRERVC